MCSNGFVTLFMNYASFLNRNVRFFYSARKINFIVNQVILTAVAIYLVLAWVKKFLPLTHQATSCSPPLVSIVLYVTHWKSFYKKNKETSAKPDTLTLVCIISIMMSFTVCIEVILWSVWEKIGLAWLCRDTSFACSNPSFPKLLGSLLDK